MRSGCIKLGILVVILSLIIYLIKNKDEIFKKINLKIKNKKILLNILFFCIVLVNGYYVVKIGTIFIANKKINNIIDENNDIFEEADLKIKEESITYNDLMSKDYDNQNYNMPYIPEGFHYIEGTWNEGFVIQDDFENQYVWVPCTNKINKEAPKLKRINMCAVPFINNMSCYNETYEDFIKSALENGGFYISRYEIGIVNNKPVSKAGVPIYSNITKKEAQDIVKEMYENINCELINGYAYDTTLEWIKNTRTKREYWNFIELKNNEKEILTGRNSNNNIYDFCDNILEFSQENLYDTIIIRGFFNSYITTYTESIFAKESRYCVQEEDKNFGLETPITMRTILYI